MLSFTLAWVFQNLRKVDIYETRKKFRQTGNGTAFSVLAEAKKLEAKGKPMIHLGLGQPDFKTPKHVVDAAKKALDDGHHGYVMSNGIPECRQAVTRSVSYTHLRAHET